MNTIDNFTKEQRRKASYPLSDQSKKLVSKALWHEGIKCRKNAKDLYGRPDISINKYKVVIFIDSCFWHSCPIHRKNLYLIKNIGMKDSPGIKRETQM